MGEPYYRITKERMDELLAEIAALQEQVQKYHKHLAHMTITQNRADARDAALEEAARLCDGLTDPTTAKLYDAGCEDCAAAIRELKDKHDANQ